MDERAYLFAIILLNQKDGETESLLFVQPSIGNGVKAVLGFPI